MTFQKLGLYNSTSQIRNFTLMLEIPNTLDSYKKCHQLSTFPRFQMYLYLLQAPYFEGFHILNTLIIGRSEIGAKIYMINQKATQLK